MMNRLARWSDPAAALTVCLAALFATVDVQAKALYTRLARIRTSKLGREVCYAFTGQAGLVGRFGVLVQERADLIKKVGGVIDASEKEGRGLTDDEKTAAKADHDRIDAINGLLDVMGRQRDLERLAVVPDDGRVQVAAPNAENDPMMGFYSAADFASAVRSAGLPGGKLDHRLISPGQARFQAAPSTYHQESGTAEGYMVPPAIRDSIWEIALSDEDLLGLVQPEPTESNSVELIADETTPWASTGIQAKWRAEASQMSPSKLATNARQVRLHELYAFVLSSDELLSDAPRLNARLTKGAARAIQWKSAQAIMYGTGAGQPLGWFTGTSLVSVAKEGSQVSNTLVAQNVLKMFSRLLVGPGSRPTWFMNRDVVPQLVDLKIGAEPSWKGQNEGLQSAPSGLLLGYPIRFTEQCQTLGTKGDVQLVDLSGYYATVKSGEGVRFDTSIHLYFDYGIQAFRWTFRLGGQPYLSAAVAAAHGSATKSHFVCLDTRT